MGMKKTYKTVFSSEAGNIDTIIVSGGRVGLQIETSAADLVKLLNSSIQDVTL